MYLYFLSGPSWRPARRTVTLLSLVRLFVCCLFVVCCLLGMCLVNNVCSCLRYSYCNVQCDTKTLPMFLTRDEDCISNWMAPFIKNRAPTAGYVYKWLRWQFVYNLRFPCLLSDKPKLSIRIVYCGSDVDIFSWRDGVMYLYWTWGRSHTNVCVQLLTSCEADTRLSGHCFAPSNTLPYKIVCYFVIQDGLKHSSSPIKGPIRYLRLWIDD